MDNAMNPARAIYTIAILILAGVFCLPAYAQKKDLPLTLDGLQLLPESKLAAVYADPEADLAVYDSLLLLDAQVAFRKNWQRDINQNRPFNVRNEDILRIRNDVAVLFHEIFTQALESAGFRLVSEQSPGALIIRPAILDLNVRSPANAGPTTTRNISESAGDMTLYLELRDSITGDVLAKAMDFQFDRSNITTFMMDSTRNERAARRILSGWAEVLVNGLEEAGVSATGRP
jgi:hypothetical protein